MMTAYKVALIYFNLPWLSLFLQTFFKNGVKSFDGVFLFMKYRCATAPNVRVFQFNHIIGIVHTNYCYRYTWNIVFSLFESWFFSVKRRVGEEITSSSSAQCSFGISFFDGWIKISKIINQISIYSKKSLKGQFF